MQKLFLTPSKKVFSKFTLHFFPPCVTARIMHESGENEEVLVEQRQKEYYRTEIERISNNNKN